MQMNQWLWTGGYLVILLTLLIIPLNAINAAATHDHAIRNTSVGGESSVSAVRSSSILPIGHSVGVDAVAFAAGWHAHRQRQRRQSGAPVADADWDAMADLDGAQQWGDLGGIFTR
jgi:hypothetical protein